MEPMTTREYWEGAIREINIERKRIPKSFSEEEKWRYLEHYAWLEDFCRACIPEE